MINKVRYILARLWGLFVEGVYYTGISILYKRVGKCNMCGKCCRHVYLRDRGKLVKSFKEYFEMVRFDSSLSKFVPQGRNEYGEIYFACSKVRRDGKCGLYEKRPFLCRAYPDLSMLRYGAVPKGDCGFSFVNRFTGKVVE